jgi:hypothetical protein
MSEGFGQPLLQRVYLGSHIEENQFPSDILGCRLFAEWRHLLLNILLGWEHKLI